MSAIQRREKGFKAAVERARLGKLSIDAPQWSLAAPESLVIAEQRSWDAPSDFEPLIYWVSQGMTVAHFILKNCGLPADFHQWHIRDAKGDSVAHLAASLGKLPVGIDVFHFENNAGETVAHVLAGSGRTLPERFEGWHWADKSGRSVIDAARESGCGTLVAQYEAWRLRQAARGHQKARARIVRPQS